MYAAILEDNETIKFFVKYIKNIILTECKVRNENKISKIGIEEVGQINIIIYIEQAGVNVLYCLIRLLNFTLKNSSTLKT